MRIQALKPFTLRDNTSGGLTSVACGSVVSVDDTLGASLISDGLATEYTLITPTGNVSITANGDHDVAVYASASVAVPEPTGSETIDENGTYNIKNKASVVINVGVVTLTYNANGGTGSVSAVTVGKGTEVSLSDGTGLVAPSEKVFGGWGATAEATEAVESPYKVSADTTLYAIWNNAT